jgi:formylglycine-generating enzyme required for sulfatase activity
MNFFCGGACRYYEKRLPESWEWQFVAQGGTQRRFPWGDDEDCESCAPPQDNTRCITVSFISLVSSLKNGRLPRQARDRLGTNDRELRTKWAFHHAHQPRDAEAF